MRVGDEDVEVRRDFRGSDRDLFYQDQTCFLQHPVFRAENNGLQL